ncbi:MAG: alpha-2-macroglobulin, partial [Planctomycetaceae bacterium]|nr:alpha-2-macroglobulin [Planctomycetaceae bacterium]
MQRFIFLTLTVLFFTISSVYAAEKTVDRTNPMSSAEQLINQGLHKDALDLLRPWILDPKTAARDIPDKDQAIAFVCQSLQKLNRVSETDEFLEKAAEIHQTDWKMLNRIATTYINVIQHYGFIIDGKFQRGSHRGGGQWIDTTERDRIYALRLFVQAMPLIVKDNDKQKIGSFFIRFADAVIFNNRSRNTAWKLQSLTDLNTLPDYEPQQYFSNNISKTPVDVDGNPIYYYIPESWETAKNDGERWRWLLDQAEKQNPDLHNKNLLQWAQFCQSQFGEQTLQSSGFFRNKTVEPETTASILNLETLGDDETIAQLATGIKRFKMPDEFNYIALYKKILETGNKDSEIAALESLAAIYKNRRQFSRAANCYEKAVQKCPDEQGKKHWQGQLNQIIGNWGHIEPSGSKVAGLHAELRYVFRNGKKVHLTAHRIDDKKLIEDIKTYIQSKPQKVDHNKLQINQIGWQLINSNEKESLKEKYIGKEVAKWSVELQPAEKHFNRATTISVPIQQSGAYLIRAKMENGNAESVVLWLNDTVIVQKMLDNSLLYFVADAETGQPVAGADVKFFGYKIEYTTSPAANNRQRQKSQPTWQLDNITKKTDENGCVILERKPNDFSWLMEVTAPEKERFTHWGFNNIWFNNYYDQQYHSVRAFIITDRPVYRPLDTVKIKAWVGTAKYDLPDTNEWAGKTIRYEIYNPRGEKITEKENIKLDPYGGMTAELELPKDAMLGIYRFIIQGQQISGQGGTFRVEEYKKPEYEVTVDAPKEPVKLGDKITATIQAKYYFGSPVTDATVKYKVLREKANDYWYPIRYWDWFYGCGYSWFAYDSPWLNGWTRWGCSRPLPFWLPHYSGPPEIAAEQEVNISEDGTVKVVIDTEIAKELFPNDNQKYTITAEVIDKSRRTIVGTGNILAAKEPFKIYAWTDNGFYRPNQRIAASFQARRLDGKPVSGNGTVKLYKITYKNENVNDNVQTVAHESEVHTETVTFNEGGTAQLILNATESGQYRISCTLNAQEGGYVFNVYEQNNQQTVNPHSESFQYNALELIPDKAEFAPNENVTLRINTERENSFVLLFGRASNGVVAKPKLLRLNGKSHEISIPVELRDMPNFFVEALTVSGGEVINETKEIVVPPQKKILNVEVKPSAEIYKPNEKATAELVVTDLDGKPVTGQIAVSIYDKSVEYISGGSNVGDIKTFFWKWRRRHSPQSTTNLLRYFDVMPEPNKPSMQKLGLFDNMQHPVYAMDGMAGGMGGGFRPEFQAESSTMSVTPRSSKKNASGMRSTGHVESLGFKGMNGLTVEENLTLPASESVTENIIEPAIRKNFADAALWIGTLETDEKGVAKIELDMPESLTTWKINVWTMATGTRVGYGNSEVITRKDLILRMQTPRFLIEKDKILLTANVHNYLKTEKDVQVVLEIDDHLVNNSPQNITKIKIAPNSESRIDWLVEAKTAGNTVIRMKALTDEESDAMEKTLPI